MNRIEQISKNPPVTNLYIYIYIYACLVIEKMSFKIIIKHIFNLKKNVLKQKVFIKYQKKFC